MKISLDQEREKIMKNFGSYHTPDQKNIDQALRKYGAYVERYTKKKTLDAVLALLDKLELKEAEIYSSGADSNIAWRRWKHIRNSITDQLCPTDKPNKARAERTHPAPHDDCNCPLPDQGIPMTVTGKVTINGGSGGINGGGGGDLVYVCAACSTFHKNGRPCPNITATKDDL